MVNTCQAEQMQMDYSGPDFMEARIKLHNACLYLSARCDGAMSEDGQGFNKNDANFGHSLAEHPFQKWSQNQAHWAQKMLKKYRAQLERGGIDLSGLPEIEKPENPQLRAVPHRESHPSGVSFTPRGVIQFQFPYDPEAVKQIREISGRRWNAEKLCWTAPQTMENLEAALAFGHQWKLEIAPEIKEAHAELREGSEETSALSRAKDAELDTPTVTGELYGFQKAGVKYALSKKRVLIADEMGLGKTVQALATVELADAYPAVVVVPAAVKFNWEKEIVKWLPHRSSVVLSGRTVPWDVEIDADFIIINYDVLAPWVDTLKKLEPETVIFDESHYLKNSRTQRTKAAIFLAKGIDHRIALTGTPVLNRPRELPSQLKVLGVLKKLFGSSWNFMQTYTNASNDGWGWKFEGGRNLEKLNRTLREHCYVRRLKKDVLTDLPPKIYDDVIVGITNRQRYETAERDIGQWVADKAIQDEDFLGSIEDLTKEEQFLMTKQHHSDTKWKTRQAEALVKITTLKRLAAKGKMKTALEWIEDFIEGGEKLVVFAWHREIVEKVAKHFRTPFMIHGDVPPKKRVEICTEFGKPDTHKILVANMQAGGTGLDGMQGSCSNALFLELGWNPASHSQPEDRLHRIGQKDSVTSHYMLAKGTIDELIFKLLMKKAVLVDATTEGGKDRMTESIFNEVVKELRRKGELND